MKFVSFALALVMQFAPANVFAEHAFKNLSPKQKEAWEGIAQGRKGIILDEYKSERSGIFFAIHAFEENLTSSTSDSPEVIILKFLERHETFFLFAGSNFTWKVDKIKKGKKTATVTLKQHLHGIPSASHYIIAELSDQGEIYHVWGEYVSEREVSKYANIASQPEVLEKDLGSIVDKSDTIRELNLNKEFRTKPLLQYQIIKDEAKLVWVAWAWLNKTRIEEGIYHPVPISSKAFWIDAVTGEILISAYQSY